MALRAGLPSLPSLTGQWRAGGRQPSSTHYRLCSAARAYETPSNRSRNLAVRVKAARTEAPNSSFKAGSEQYNPTNARDAVESGLKTFKEAHYEEAVSLFKSAMELSPNDDEARAALYNLGCALTRLKRWGEASDAIVRAINDYSLKLTVALQDDDLRQLRDRREWMDALTRVRGGLSRAAKADLRSEAKAPFRLTRLFVLGSLSAGAGLGLVIIGLRLARAMSGGEGAPDLTESLTNFGINAAVLAVLGFFLKQDLDRRSKAKKTAEREEALSRLQVDLGKERQFPLLRLRGQVRPVIVAGSRDFVEKAIWESDKHQRFLKERGVAVVPIVFGSEPGKFEDPSDRIRALKQELQSQAAPRGKGFGGRGTGELPVSTSTQEGSSSSSNSSGPLLEADKKWRLQAYNIDEWREWVQEQAVLAKLPAGTIPECYVQVQLDGSVRSSGVGIPPWGKFVEDLPELDSIRTKFGDGIGTDV